MSFWRPPHRRQTSFKDSVATLFTIVAILLALSLSSGLSVTATLRTNRPPAMHSLVVWPGPGTTGQYEKRVETLGPTLSNISRSILAYDGPHLAYEARAQLDIKPQSNSSDGSDLSLQIEASVNCTVHTNGSAFSFVDQQIEVYLPKDSYFFANPPAFSGTNRGGIRFSGPSVYSGPVQGGVLRAGTYVIDIYLRVEVPYDTNSLTGVTRSDSASAGFSFAHVKTSENPPPPTAQPTPEPIGNFDTFVYFDALPTNSPQFDSMAYFPSGDATQFARGHPWSSYEAYENLYSYIDGGSAYGYRTYQNLLNTDWVTASPSGQWSPSGLWTTGSSRIFYSHTMDTNSSYSQYLVLSTSGAPAWWSEFGGQEYLPLGLDASGGTFNIDASYAVRGNSTFSTSMGFMLRIDVDDRGAIVSYNNPPTGPHETIKTFHMGVPLSAGSYFFGVIADPKLMPWIYDPQIPWYSSQGGQGSVSLNVSRLPKAPEPPPPAITNFFRDGTNPTLRWSDELNRPVHVQRRHSLSTGAWETIRSNVTSKTFTDTNAPSGSAFYRLLVP